MRKNIAKWGFAMMLTAALLLPLTAMGRRNNAASVQLKTDPAVMVFGADGANRKLRVFSEGTASDASRHGANWEVVSAPDWISLDYEGSYGQSSSLSKVSAGMARMYSLTPSDALRVMRVAVKCTPLPAGVDSRSGKLVLSAGNARYTVILEQQR